MPARPLTGTVKWYNPVKGYGFIAPHFGGNDVFVHSTALVAAGLPTLAEGQQVQFEEEDNRGRTCAVRLKVMAGAHAV